MLYLELFLTFFQIGLFGFGGGYAMLSMIQGEVVTSHGWLSSAEFTDIVAISQMTPGPIGINSATYVGYTAAINAGYSHVWGILGSITATFAVVLPSFIVILIISALLKNFLKYKGVGAFLSGVRPCVVSLILGTAITLFLSVLLGIGAGDFELNVDFIGIVIFALVVGISLIYKKKKGKKPSPILMIAISACLGMILYSLPI